MIFGNKAKEDQGQHILLTDIQHSLSHAVSEIETGFEHLSRSPEYLEEAKEFHLHGVSRIRAILKAIEKRMK